MKVRTAAQAIAWQERKKRMERERERQRRRNERIRRFKNLGRFDFNPEEYRQFIRFMICASAFVILVGVKLFSGDHAVTLRERLSEAMGRNMDIQAVFSAVGERFAGDDDGSDAARRIYQAVFRPEEMEAAGDAVEDLNGGTVETVGDAGEAVGGTGESVGETANFDAVAGAEQSGDFDAETAVLHQWTGRLRDGMALETLRDTGAESENGENQANAENGASNGVNDGAESNTSDGASNGAENSANNGASNGAENGESAENGENNAENENAEIVYTGDNMPERVMMEQVILNWDYVSPLTGVLTSPFGYRYHPTEGAEKFHYGIDLAADTGTDIVCFADGNVTAVGDSVTYGRYCMIAHDGGFTTLYAHCERVTAIAGADVTRGEKIAEVGATGNATGPHLHFELRRDNVWLNPVYYISG